MPALLTLFLLQAWPWFILSGIPIWCRSVPPNAQHRGKASSVAPLCPQDKVQILCPPQPLPTSSAEAPTLSLCTPHFSLSEPLTISPKHHTLSPLQAFVQVGSPVWRALPAPLYLINSAHPSGLIPRAPSLSCIVALIPVGLHH